MVDWASQDRLYPSGYRAIDIRQRNIRINSSLPYSISLNKKHNCRSQLTQIRNADIPIEIFSDDIHQTVRFFNEMNDNTKRSRIPKLIATYISNIDWPRSVCCLAESDGSLIVCEQDRCRLVLFSSHLMVRSTCGGTRGNGDYQFNSPWSVAALFDQSSPHILVADTNNQRIQCFAIGYDYQFVFKYILMMKEKPYYIASSKQHFAVSCEKGFICTFLGKNQTLLTNINLNKISSIQKVNKNAYCICMNIENSCLFLNNPLGLTSNIHQLTVHGEYLRSIKLDHQPYLHISSLTYDSRNGQLIIADALNSIIYSVEHDLDEDNVEILIKRCDNLNHPQSLCVSNEGHLIVAECSVLTQHALKIFRHHSCQCHSRLVTSSVKTSETTSVRSLMFQY